MSKERDIGSKDFWSVDDLTPPMGKTTKHTALPKPTARDEQPKKEAFKKRRASRLNSSKKL